MKWGFQTLQVLYLFITRNDNVSESQHFPQIKQAQSSVSYLLTKWFSSSLQWAAVSKLALLRTHSEDWCMSCIVYRNAFLKENTVCYRNKRLHSVTFQLLTLVYLIKGQNVGTKNTNKTNKSLLLYFIMILRVKLYFIIILTVKVCKSVVGAITILILGTFKRTRLN